MTPPMPKKPLPTEIELHWKSRVLETAFDGGARYRLPCEFLRVYLSERPMAAIPIPLGNDQ